MKKISTISSSNRVVFASVLLFSFIAVFIGANVGAVGNSDNGQADNDTTNSNEVRTTAGRAITLSKDAMDAVRASIKAKIEDGSLSGSSLIERAKELRGEAAQKLEDNALKTCQNRQQVIANVMTRMSSRLTNQLGILDKIRDKALSLYEQNSYQLSNYEELMNQIEATRGEALSANQVVESDDPASFNCGSDDPKGAAAVYKGDVESSRTAMSQYKAAIRSLVVAMEQIEANSATEEN